MTDIHTHILFGIDDGAKDIDTSLKMLKSELSDGVDTVVLSPHFNPSRTNTAHFLSVRDTNAKILKNAYKDEISILTAAEIVINPFLHRLENLDSLCIEGTKVLLLEIPVSSSLPIWLEDAIYQLVLSGYTPVLVHIERYKFLRDIPTLKKLTELGAVTQVNCSLFDSPGFFEKRFINKAAKLGLLHVMGSDCHSDSWRKPCYLKGLNNAAKIVSKEFSQKLKDNTNLLVKKGTLNNDNFIIL